MYFIPDKLPISGLDWQALAPLIGRANAKLSNYNGILHNMVNPKILLSPLTKQEAVLSSKIEGTRASLSDIYQKDLGEKYDQEKENDIEEINNYRNALNLRLCMFIKLILMQLYKKIVIIYPLQFNLLQQVQFVI